MNFTQLDMVTLFPPPGTTAGVRVGWVQGDINGTITMNSILTATPPTFTATGTAVIVDTNGDQLFVNVAFKGTFAGGADTVRLAYHYRWDEHNETESTRNAPFATFYQQPWETAEESTSSIALENTYRRQLISAHISD